MKLENINAKNWPKQIFVENSRLGIMKTQKWLVEISWSVVFRGFFLLGVFPNNAGGPLLHLCLFIKELVAIELV